jgi:hypothetical protein
VTSHPGVSPVVALVPRRPPTGAGGPVHRPETTHRLDLLGAGRPGEDRGSVLEQLDATVEGAAADHL